jgi:hypothetical protein
VTIKKYPKEIKREDFITVRNTSRGGVIQNVIAPNGLQVGLNNPDFKAGLRIFGQVDTSDDILLFGNSLAAAVLDINFNPSSAVIFSDPADKEVFIQASTITADAFYSGKAMSYDGLATSNKDIITDYTYKPRFDAITGDNGIGTISSVSVGGAVSGTKSGTVTLTDSHDTSFMTLTFAVDSSTGDLTMTPSLTQIYTNSTEITNITLKIPVVAKSNNPKPLVVVKEVHIQKMEFPTIASHTAKPIAYVLRHNAAGAFSTLDLANVQFRVSYSEGYNYSPSSGSPVTSTDLTPNVTADVGSVNILSNGQFTIKSITDIDCTTKSSTFQAVPATSGSASKEIRLTTLSAADSSKTFAARSIETLYKTSTGLVGSDRILQQFIIQEARESVTVASTDRVRYITAHGYDGYDGGTHGVYGINLKDAEDARSSGNASVITVNHPSGTLSAKYFSEGTPTITQTTAPNFVRKDNVIAFLPMDHVFSASNISSNLATAGSLLSLSLTSGWSPSSHNESFSLPAGSYSISIKAEFRIERASGITSQTGAVALYLLLVETLTESNDHDILDNQPNNKSSAYRIIPAAGMDGAFKYQSPGITSGYSYLDTAGITGTPEFTLGFITSLTNTTKFTLVPCFEFYNKSTAAAVDSNSSNFPDSRHASLVHFPTLERTNLTLTVTEL